MAFVTIEDQSISQTAEMMTALKETLHEGYEIQHTTIQFEGENCGPDTILCAPQAEYGCSVFYHTLSCEFYHIDIVHHKSYSTFIRMNIVERVSL